jgi:hypothetical protein
MSLGLAASGARHGVTDFLAGGRNILQAALDSVTNAPSIGVLNNRLPKVLDDTENGIWWLSRSLEQVPESAQPAVNESIGLANRSHLILDRAFHNEAFEPGSATELGLAVDRYMSGMRRALEAIQ